MCWMQAALKQSQPSSKREGFATVPNVTWEHIGALQPVRRELQKSIIVRLLPNYCHTEYAFAYFHIYLVLCLQCFDAVGWAAGRASSL